MVSCANKNEIANIIVTHRGNLCVKDQNNRKITLNRILYSKDLSENLLSFYRLTKMGMKVVLDENIAEVVEKRSNCVVFVGHGEHKYWNFNFEVCDSQKRAFAMELGETEEVVEESVESESNFCIFG